MIDLTLEHQKDCTIFKSGLEKIVAALTLTAFSVQKTSCTLHSVDGASCPRQLYKYFNYYLLSFFEPFFPRPITILLTVGCILFSIFSAFLGSFTTSV